jgi:hypothetical protein
MVHTQRLASALTDCPTSSYGRRKGVTEARMRDGNRRRLRVADISPVTSLPTAPVSRGKASRSTSRASCAAAVEKTVTRAHRRPMRPRPRPTRHSAGSTAQFRPRPAEGGHDGAGFDVDDIPPCERTGAGADPIRASTIDYLRADVPSGIDNRSPRTSASNRSCVRPEIAAAFMARRASGDHRRATRIARTSIHLASDRFGRVDCVGARDRVGDKEHLRASAKARRPHDRIHLREHDRGTTALRRQGHHARRASRNAIAIPLSR